MDTGSQWQCVTRKTFLIVFIENLRQGWEDCVTEFDPPVICYPCVGPLCEATLSSFLVCYVSLEDDATYSQIL